MKPYRDKAERSRTCRSPRTTAGWACVVLLAAAPAAAQRPTPTPTPTRSPRSLAEVASSITLKKSGTTSRSIQITNENLSSYASKGGITTATGSSGGVTRGTGEPRGAVPGERRTLGDEGKKQYWRSRYQRQKQLVEDMKRRIDELNAEIPQLWSQFYAWDDPAYRDGVIKPKIDAKLQQVEELKKRLPEEEKKLPEILEEARRDGALPGWFRDLD